MKNKRQKDEKVFKMGDFLFKTMFNLSAYFPPNKSIFAQSH